MTRFDLRAWLSLFVLVGCAVPPDPSEDAALDEGPALADEADEAAASPDEPPDFLALAPDPSAVIGNGWCYTNHVWNGTAARIYYPSNGGCESSVHSPLVVMMKGNGFSHTDYHYLLRHLARNGYIAVSVDAVAATQSVAGYQAAAAKAWAFVDDYMWTTWSKRFFIDPSRVALIGHSRGGEAVQYLAESLKTNVVFDVKSVIALAPTNATNITLTGQNTLSAMVLVGANDADTRAAGAYVTHDEASSDASQQDPGIDPSVLYRSMKFLKSANHAGFASDAAQGHVTQGYVMAFLHAHLKNDITYYEDYVRGDAAPAGWLHGVTTQYSDGFLRRVVDNFDDGALANPTLGGWLSIALGAGGVIDLGASADTPHDTHALTFTPPVSGAGFLWALPVGKRDASAFKYLSLRVGQSAGPVTDDLRIRITNGGVTTPWVRLTDHGVLAQPAAMCTASQLAVCHVIEEQAHMGTIRIPLSAFGAHDDVGAIELGATSEATDGEFLIDNLEFSEFIFKP